MDDELLDLVDANDNVIGTINRMDYDQLLSEELGYIRAADLFIVNDNGQIFTPVRTADKTIAPNGFDYSAGGHVESGDDYLTTIIRESKEELDIDIDPDELEFITKTVSDKIRYIRCVYLLRSNKTPNYNRHDFVGGEWFYPEEIIRKIEEGHPAKSNLAETVTLLQDYFD